MKAARHHIKNAGSVHTALARQEVGSPAEEPTAPLSLLRLLASVGDCAALEHDRDSFELIHPHDIGQPKPEFVIGKHSGTRVLQAVLARRGITLDRSQARVLLRRVRDRAERAKRALTPDELVLLSRAITSASIRRPLLAEDKEVGP